MKILIITSCCKSKLSNPDLVEKFYTGYFFQSILHFANKNNFDFMVLSAKYGLIKKDYYVEPYDIKLKLKININNMKIKINKEFPSILNNYDKILFTMGKNYLSVFSDFLNNPKIMFIVDNRGNGGFNQIAYTLLKMSNQKVIELINTDKKVITILDLKR